MKVGDFVRVTVLPASGKLGNGKVFTAFVSVFFTCIFLVTHQALDDLFTALEHRQKHSKHTYAV